MATVWPPAAQARDEDPPPGQPGDRSFDATGLYFGLGGVYALEDFDRSFDDSAGVNARLGYRASANMAFELSYEWLEGFDSTAGAPEVELDTHLLTANAKLFALTGQLQPYLLAGIGVLIVNTELRVPGVSKPYEVDTGFTARFGGGVDLHLSERIVLNLEGSYLAPSGPVKGENYGTLGAGFQLRF